MPHQYLPRRINLAQSDYNIVRRTALERGLGKKGFSAALRMIIREWSQYQLVDPTGLTIEDLYRELIDLGLIAPAPPF
jgi:hypothetical protein